MLELLLGFKNVDSTENINARLSGLIPKGIVSGGIVTAEPASLQVRIVGTPGDPNVLLAYGTGGIMVRERAQQYVLPVTAGITNVVFIRAKYLATGQAVVSIEVASLGAFETDPDRPYLIRLSSVSPPATATAVSPEDINSSFRDSVEGFSRRIIRAVVSTKADLPSVSGFPAIAEINLIGNTFAAGTAIRVGTTNLNLIDFPIVPAINFLLADPATPGLSRVNPSQRVVISATQNGITGTVTATTGTTVVGPQASGQTSATIGIRNQLTAGIVGQFAGVLIGDLVTIQGPAPSIAGVFSVLSVTGDTLVLSSSVNDGAGNNSAVLYSIARPAAHGFSAPQQVRITNNSASQANGQWQVTTTPGLTQFTYQAPLGILPFSGTGGSVVDLVTPATVTARTAPGVQHGLTPGAQVLITGVPDPTFLGLFTVTVVPDLQTFQVTTYGYPTRDSGDGLATLSGIALPANAVETGASSTVTASNFEQVFRASTLSSDVTATAIGGSLQLQASQSGLGGNSYTLSKSEPGVLPANVQIVIQGFSGGVDPVPGYIQANLQAGDLYVVLFGDLGTMEIWGYDGISFRNLTSASTATLLDFHRRNLFANERHLTENQAGALVGTVGTPSAANPYVTKQDTGVLTTTIAAALLGADNVPPGPSNRYLTEARIRGQRDAIDGTAGTATLPLGDSWVVGHDVAGTELQYFNVVFTASLDNPGGPTEYSQVDFTPVRVSQVRRWDGLVESPLTPVTDADANGVFPRSDAFVLSLPRQLRVHLTAVPNNGPATLLYSRALVEKLRQPAADVLMGPQRILPAETASLINKTAELRFNSGILVSGTTVTFPAQLFSASNVQGYLLRRALGGTLTGLTGAFTLDLQAGTISGAVSGSFTAVPFTGLTVNLWTKYLVALTPQGLITCVQMTPYRQRSTDLDYASSLAAVATPSTPWTDGSYCFAAIGVQSSGSIGTPAIQSIVATSIELYPYQSTNSRDPGAQIVCGDGTTSYGHFSGATALTRALALALAGDTIRLLRGTYQDHTTVSTPDITIEAGSGAVLQNPAGTALTINAARFRGRNLRFQNCNVALELQAAPECTVDAPIFEATAIQRFVVPSTLAGSQINFRPANVATWTVTDGTGKFAGDFNGPGALQAAHDAASPGDLILAYPGTYTRVTWTASYLTLRAHGGSGVRVDAGGGSNAALAVSGSYNQFGGLIVQNAATGVACTGTHNTFGPDLTFNPDVLTPITFPATPVTKHYNYHPAVSGQLGTLGINSLSQSAIQPVVTVGDGASSWGDYCGPAAINLALQTEVQGTKIVVRRGIYNAISGSFSNMTIEGSGFATQIVASAPTDQACCTVNGDGNRFRHMQWLALNNGTVVPPFKTYGAYCSGFDNLFESIYFPDIAGGPTQIEHDRRFYVSSGFRNRFLPHTGGPTGYCSWTVGDGVRSFGDFNGIGAIGVAINALPSYPTAATGQFQATTGATVQFRDTTGMVVFSANDLWRHVAVTGAVNAVNQGSWRIIQYINPTTVVVERTDGQAFIDETNLVWNYLAGSKIWVLPGSYAGFTVQESRNDLDIEAWGAGGDTIVIGDSLTSPLVTINGHRCRIKGFRFAGGVPSVGVAVQVNGTNNTFDDNLFQTGQRYAFGARATGNRVQDGPESPRSTALTVSTQGSRADYVGTDQASLQAAITAASLDPLGRVSLGAGTWTLTAPVTVPANVTVQGSGYGTQLVGNGTFPALQLAAGGHQTVTGLRFTNFTNSLAGTCTGVQVYGCWLGAPIAGTITASNTASNL